MRKYLLLSLSAATLIAAAAPASAASPFCFKSKAKAKKTARSLTKARANASNWKPATTKTFGWDGEQWMLEDTYKTVYDNNGNVIKETMTNFDDEVTAIEYEYNEYNMETASISRVSTDGESFEYNEKTAKEYDPILTSVIIRNSHWFWMNQNWQQVGNNYTRTITRDAAGNVTGVEIATLFQGAYDPIQRLEVKYGPDGKATEISQQMLTYDGEEYSWVPDGCYKDIVWDRTDGQIVSYDNLLLGANRISHAVFEDEDMTLTIDVKYEADSENYKAEMTMEDEDGTTTGIAEYTALANEGYSLTSSTVYPDGYSATEIEEVNYDDWGHMTKSYSAYTEDDYTEVGENMTGVVEYDEEGLPMSYTVSQEYFDDDLEEYVTEYAFRAEYSDYSDISTGAGMTPEEAGTVRYFNMQGMPIAAPEEGTPCIRVHSGKTSKIIR